MRIACTTSAGYVSEAASQIRLTSNGMSRSLISVSCVIATSGAGLGDDSSAVLGALVAPASAPRPPVAAEEAPDTALARAASAASLSPTESRWDVSSHASWTEIASPLEWRCGGSASKPGRRAMAPASRKKRQQEALRCTKELKMRRQS